MKPFFKRCVLGIFAVVCSWTLTSCSRLDVALSWADTYIAAKVDDYFNLSSRQNKELKQALRTNIRQIRKSKFPEWAQTLRQIAREIHDHPLNEAVVDKYFRQILLVTDSLQPAFTETAVHFIGEARPEQLEHFERTVHQKNIEDEKKIQNSQKARDENRKKYLRGIELWIDSLSKEQDQLLNRHLNENPFPARALIKNRNQVLEKFSASKKSPEALKDFVRSYYTDKNQYADPEYREALRNYQTNLEKFTYQLLKSLNEKQKKSLCDNLMEKATLLEKLAAKD